MNDYLPEPSTPLFWDNLLAFGFMIYFFVNHNEIHIGTGWSGWAALMGIISIGWLARHWYGAIAS